MMQWQDIFFHENYIYGCDRQILALAEVGYMILTSIDKSKVNINRHPAQLHRHISRDDSAWLCGSTTTDLSILEV